MAKEMVQREEEGSKKKSVVSEEVREEPMEGQSMGKERQRREKKTMSRAQGRTG